MTVKIRQIKYSFAVIGVPISLQSSSRARQNYQKLVSRIASEGIAHPIKNSERVRIEIDWFSEGFKNKPDIDNIAKPIQDALKGIVFVDDDQVVSIEARKHNILYTNHFNEEPLCIVEPLLNGHSEYIFVRIY